MLEPKNVCRCCLIEGCYKDISTEYFWSGQKEVYADMLLDTFNIIISHQEGVGPSSGSRLICDMCITKLREAAAFKQQILKVETNILQHLKLLQKNDNVLEALIDMKVEKLNYDSLGEEDYDTFQNVYNDVKSGSDYDTDLVLQDEMDKDAMDDYDKEPPGELFVIKMLPQARSKGKKSKSHNTEKRSELKKFKENVVKRKAIKKSKVNELQQLQADVTKRRKPLKTPLAELKMRENTVKLILNSNMCVFKSLRIKYQCFYCKERYFQIDQLKDHIKTHNCDKEKALKVGRASCYKNAEISNLTCNICTESCPDIEYLKQHLSDKHDIQFEPVGHLLVPFKIENELKCVVCEDRFNTFTRLLIHMNKHYTNHVCETCGVSFINKVSLRVHVTSLHKERKCASCPAIFSTSSARYKHIIKVHDPTRRSKRYCHLCNKTFKYTYMLYEHRIQEHGEERHTASCKDCNKTFISPNNLKLHIRSVHLKERNYPCSYCAMRFFTSTDQKRHEKTHGVSESDLIMCSYCDTKFKSKDSWRRHVNKQHARLY